MTSNDRAPLAAGDLVQVLYYDTRVGTVLGEFPVLSCRLWLPRPTDGTRWNLTYDRDGEQHSVLVDANGIDRHRTVRPVRR